MLHPERDGGVHDDGRGRRRVSLQVVDGDEAEDRLRVVDVPRRSAGRKFDGVAPVGVVEESQAVAGTAKISFCQGILKGEV